MDPQLVEASLQPHTDVSRNLATVAIRGVLPGLKRRRTGLLPSGPKSSFQMRASFVFNLETKVLESGGRVEKIIAQVAWSPVLSFHSLWWFGLQCHLLVLVHCVKKKKIIIIFPAGFGTCPHCQKHQKLVKWPWCWCAWLAIKLTRPEQRIYGVLSRGKWETRDQKNTDELKASQRNLGFHTTSAVPQTDHLHATPNWGSN